MPAPATKITDDQIEEVLRRTTEGESLASICRDPEMPGRMTIYDWIEEDSPRYWEEFAVRFRASRRVGIDQMADQCLEIADRNDLEANDKRVRIDTRLRLAGKWLPSIYGDKVDVTSGNKPIQPALSDREVALAIFKMAAIAKQQTPMIEGEFRDVEGDDQ